MIPVDKKSTTFFGCYIWFLASLFFLYEFFLRTFISSIAAEVTKALQLNAEHLSLIGGAYFITYGVMQVFVGVFIDKFGVKKLLTVATFVCVSGVFLFVLSHNFTMLFISRLLMGLGSSFGFICLLMLSLDWFPRENFGFLSGLSQFIGALGPMLAGAPLVFVLAKLHDNWRVALSYVGMMGAVLGFLILIFVRSRSEQKEYGVKVLTIQRTVYNKLQGFLKNRQAWLIIIYASLVNSSLAMLGIVWGATYLKTLHLSMQEAAFVSSLIWLGYALGAPVLGWVSDSFKRRKMPLIICALTGVALSIFMLYGFLHNVILLAIVFLGLGVAGAGQSLAFALMSEQVKPEIHATGFGFNNALIMLSTAALIPLFGALIQFMQSGVGEQIGQYQMHDFTLGLIFMLSLYIIAAIIAIFGVKETFCRQQDVIIKLQVES